MKQQIICCLAALCVLTAATGLSSTEPASRSEQSKESEKVFPCDKKTWRVRDNSLSVTEIPASPDGKGLSCLEISFDPSLANTKKSGEIFTLADISFNDFNFVELSFRCENAEPSLKFIGSNWKGAWNSSFSRMLPTPYSYQRSGYYSPDPKNGVKMNPAAPLEDGKDYTIVCGLGGAKLHMPQGAMQTVIQLEPRDAGKTVKFNLYGVRFFRAPEPYEALNRKYDEYIANYTPDYSDSSNCLLPPEGNRFDSPFAVVKDGKPSAAILYSTKENPVLETAAKELNKYLKLISGAELPVFTDESAVPKGINRIILGREFAPKSSASVLKKLEGRDGYAIIRDGSALYILSAMPKGAMNGVFDMLEKNTDIIWARPDESLGTVCTERKDIDFVWGKDIVYIPATPARGWNGFADLEWMAHNGCNLAHGGGGGDISWMIPKKRAYGILYVRSNSGHNIFSYLAGAPEKHPDYYAHDDDGNWTGGQPCFSSPKLKELFIKNVLKDAEIADKAKADYVCIALQDTWKSCPCRNCRAPITLLDGKVVKETDDCYVSTRFFMFLNDVAKAVTEKYPDLKILTLAYFQTLPPPECDVNTAIVPEFAPYPRANDRTPISYGDNALYMTYLEGWAKKVPRLETYNYHGLGLEFPRPLADVCQFDFAAMHPYVLGMSSEYRDRNEAGDKWGRDYSAMEFWVLTRLYRDPSQNVEQLRKYFIRRTFREAAPAMEKFYGKIREKWLKTPGWSTIGADIVNSTQAIIIGNNLEDELRTYLEEAEKTAVNPKAKELVKRVRTRFERGIDVAKSKAKK